MKRLIIAMAAALAVTAVFAKISDRQEFESSFSDFVPSVQDEDSSELASHGEATPSIDAPYPCASFGAKYLELDTGAATLWRANAVTGNVYFDMAMQFVASAAAPDFGDDTGTKLSVYLTADGYIAVSAGTSAADRTRKEYVTTTTLEAGTWARVTVSAVTGADGLAFKVYINGTAVTDGTVDTFPCLTADTTISSVGFSGTGALDNFVARTTDPYFSGTAVATIGGANGEKYATYNAALADALETTTASAPVAIAVGSTTMDGSAANPYQIQTASDLVALQNAVLANEGARSLNYVQTANIDMAGVAGFYGIGWFESSTSFASVPTGVASDGKTAIPFAGTYDGAGYTISNVTLVRHNYAGVFNNVSGTVKDLTVQNIGFSGTCSEWGCAIVGNAGSGSLLENLTAAASTVWGDSANHNVAGIVVRPIGAATIRGCVNNADISATAKRLGGIASFVGSGTTGTVFDSCTNNATLVSTDGTRGVGGILGCAEGGVKNSPTDADTIIRNCADFGSETAQGSGGHAGAIVGSNWNESYTYTDGGGNAFKASTADCGYVKNAVFGRAYATALTIDNTDYLTTVAQADLAAGNTYTLLADVAASATPVFTLTTVGDTIAFNTNGYNFAGTVAGTSTIVVTDSTVDAVKTFTAAAGVASVDDVAYATFADALAAIKDDDDETTDDFVTLIADNVVATINSATTIKVKTNDHPFTPTIVGDFALSTTTDGNGITTYTTAIGVAKIGTTAYASFADAYAVAKQTPGTVIVLLAEVDETITAVDGETMNFSIDKGEFTSSSIELNVPANVTVNIASSSAVGGVTVLSGEGRIVATTQAQTLTSLVQQSTWCGTLEVKNASWANTIVRLDQFGNKNSTVCANYIFFAPANDGNSVKALEIGANGLTLEGAYASGTFAFPCALTGSGRITVKVKDSASGTTLKGVQFIGDSTGFAGSVAFDENANAYVQFGSTGIASSELAAKRILTGDDAVVTVASGKTWTSSNFMLHGTVTLDGDLRALDGTTPGSVWNNHSSAVLTVNKAGAFQFGNSTSWEGRYVVNYDNAAATGAFVMPQKATTVINGVEGAFNGYPTTGSAAPNVTGEVVLNANWTIGDGYPGTGSKTTFAKLSGSGNLTTCTKTVSGTVYYEIKKLDKYTGVITVSSGTDVTIGCVNVSELPAEGTCVVKTATGAVNTDVPLYVGDVATGKTLEYKADGADGAGLYVADEGGTVIDPANSDSIEVAGDGTESPADIAAGVTVQKPAAASAVADETYQGYFTKTAVYADGKWVVTAAIAETVETGVEASAIAALTDATAETIAIPAGLYYRITPAAELGTWGTAATGLSSGSVDAPAISNSAERKGFYKVELSATPFK